MKFTKTTATFLSLSALVASTIATSPIMTTSEVAGASASRLRKNAVTNTKHKGTNKQSRGLKDGRKLQQRALKGEIAVPKNAFQQGMNLYTNGLGVCMEPDDNTICGQTFTGPDTVIKLEDDVKCIDGKNGPTLQDGASIDCNGHIIFGSGTSANDNSIGITIDENSDASFIKDCVVTEFAGAGIFIKEGTTSTKLKKVNVYQNGGWYSNKEEHYYGSGIVMLGSEDATFEDIISTNHPNGHGIYIEDASQLTLTKVETTKNGDYVDNDLIYHDVAGVAIAYGAGGIWITNSSHVTMETVTANHNHLYGIMVMDSQTVSLQNGLIRNNKNEDIHIIAGLQMIAVDSATLQNVQSVHNDRYGIYIHGDNPTLQDVLSNDNLHQGMKVSSKNKNDSGSVIQLTNIMVHDNGEWGLEVREADTAILENVSVSNNGNKGIYFREINDNLTLEQVVVVNNGDAGIELNKIPSTQLLGDVVSCHNYLSTQIGDNMDIDMHESGIIGQVSGGVICDHCAEVAALVPTSSCSSICN